MRETRRGIQWDVTNPRTLWRTARRLPARSSERALFDVLILREISSTTIQLWVDSDGG